MTIRTNTVMAKIIVDKTEITILELNEKDYI